MTVMSLPTWFDWSRPGTFMALFSLWSLPNHMPLLHLASTLPLFMHTLPVKTVILFISRFIPLVRFLMAGVSDIFAGSVKIQKHSASEFLHVIVGSKVTSLSVCSAILFLAFLLGVSDRLSTGAVVSGLYFGAMSWMRAFASRAHSCGFLQPFWWLCIQSGHMHAGVGWWFLHLWCTWSLFDSFIRSSMDFATWFFNRHLKGTFVIGWFIAPGWYHNRSRDFSLVVIWRAPRFVLDFLAIFSILIMSVPS